MSGDALSLARAADTLRAWALDEDLKAKVMANPATAMLAARAASRYTAGEDLTDALDMLRRNAVRGHRGSIECVGESVREASVARRETAEFVELARRMGHQPQPATISFDLSHLGSLVSRDLGLANALIVAQAARAAGTSVMISAEGSDRTDLVLDLYEEIADAFPESGITLQARLHRTPTDMQRVMNRPGTIRIVKGAFLEPESVAHLRDSGPMTRAYVDLATDLVRAGHGVNLATHDAGLVAQLQTELGDALMGAHVEFEMLQGLGTELLDSLHQQGFATREYIVYGREWWLYVLNRIAEHPERVIQALADLQPPT